MTSPYADSCKHVTTHAPATTTHCTYASTANLDTHECYSTVRQPPKRRLQPAGNAGASRPLVLLGQNATVEPHRTSSRCLAISKPVHAQSNCLNRPSISQLYLFPSKRFHVLLNSLFKVLCNFPSRYLFAIGLTVILSLR